MDNQTYLQIIASAEKYRRTKQEEVVHYMVQLAYKQGFNAGQESVKKQQAKEESKENVAQ